MKIEEIQYESIDEINKMKRFDTNILPKKQLFLLKHLIRLISLPETIACKSKIEKINMENLKGPYLLLCNHNSFIDFKVTEKAIYPQNANFVVAIDGFINRENLLRYAGCVGKRKFVNDINLIRQLKYCLTKLKSVTVIYPEARYSLCGSNSVIPESLGKMIKNFNFPVVTLICNGHHLRQPVWNLTKRKVPITAKMTQILTKDDIQNKSVEEINKIINENFVYDDYKYQYDNKIKIDYEKRAEGLHKVLYQCPHCKVEYKMNSQGNTLFCENCGKVYEMDEYGKLFAKNGETEISHIPDWYSWEREQVKQQILNGTYKVESEVYIDSLPNATGYYRIGKGNLIHDLNGFHISANLPNNQQFNLEKKVLEDYSVHIEYEYFKKGDSVNLSTLNDTYYMFPLKQNIVTKINIAVEELYKLKKAE